MSSSWRTKGVYEGVKHAGTRALMKSGGLAPGDFDKPLIGIHNTYTEGGPGHIHLNTLTQEVRAGIYQAGGVPIEFGGPGHCPNLLPEQHDVPQRDIIAMSVENFVELHVLDAVVCVGSCDKPNPAHWLAAARLSHIPVIMALGGPALPGWFHGNRINVSTVKQAAFTYCMGRGDYSEQDILDMEDCSSTGPGACALCGTANTTAILSEVLGLTLPNGGAIPAVSAKRRWISRETGRRVVKMVQEGLNASKILTPEALENAIIVMHALGGSSNAVFHILALAEDLGIGDRINVDLIEHWGKKIPCLANVMPSGKYGVAEFGEVGGVAALMKELEAYLHADAMTVTGRTWGEMWSEAQVLDADIIRPLDRPVFGRGLAVLKGNLATSAIIRYSVFPDSLRKFAGPARAFNSQADAHDAVVAGKVHRGDAIVVKYEGPRGGPGMPDLFNLMYELHSADLADYCPLITDGKFSGFAQGPFVCQLTPEAAVGGPFAVVQDGDIIEIDVENNRLDVRLTKGELDTRLKKWSPMPPKVRYGYLTLWARMANSAAKGAGLPYWL